MTFPPNNQLMFDITSKIKREIHDELSVNGIIFNIQNKGGKFWNTISNYNCYRYN